MVIFPSPRPGGVALWSRKLKVQALHLRLTTAWRWWLPAQMATITRALNRIFRLVPSYLIRGVTVLFHGFGPLILRFIARNNLTFLL